MQEQLLSRLLQLCGSTDVTQEAQRRLSLAKSMGLTSDWEGTEKELDFARLCVAVQSALPPGGSIETGVLRGGTSGLLILSCAAESFHVSIDPYGLPSQSYEGMEYQDWKIMRSTLRALTELADDCDVGYSHYLTDSMSFISADLLHHPGPFRIVHLDGDHSYEVARVELEYFTRKLDGPAVFVLDDHDENFPGVGEAVGEFPRLARLFHRKYVFPPYGVCGFSAWLHSRG